MMKEDIIVKIPLLPLLQLLLQGSLQKEEVKQPHGRYIQRPNMNDLLTPGTPDHLPLPNLPYFPEQCNPCGKKFSRKSRLSKHMLVVHGASLPPKILQDRYPAKLMACRRTSFVIRYIAFKTRIRFKKHMKRGAHLMAPGHKMGGL